MKKVNFTLPELIKEYEKTSEEASKGAEKFGADKFITAIAVLDKQVRAFNTSIEIIRDEIKGLRDARAHELEMKKIEGELETKKLESRKLDNEVRLRELELLSGKRHEGGDVLDEIKKLNTRIDWIEGKFEESKSKGVKEEDINRSEEWLSPRDQEIINYIREHSRASAEEIKEKFKYKGSNAATNRMNNLYRQGVLKKQRVGRIMYFALSE